MTSFAFFVGTFDGAAGPALATISDFTSAVSGSAPEPATLALLGIGLAGRFLAAAAQALDRIRAVTGLASAGLLLGAVGRKRTLADVRYRPKANGPTWANAPTVDCEIEPA